MPLVHSGLSPFGRPRTVPYSRLVARLRRGASACPSTLRRAWHSSST